MICPNCHTENPENTKFCGNCATPLPQSDETQEIPTKTLDTSLPDLNTGSILAGRYEIIEEMGSGGMGKVYKANDKEVKEKIVLKLIRPEIASNKKVIERFRNELKMARKIAHRNVCRMYDLEKEENMYFITMEYVPGEDLKKSIIRMGSLTVGKAVFIAKQICEGLSEAHRLGVVHRDLKPHNIMIDRDGNTRIMDFGIAFSLKDDLTDSGMILGTPQYLSPEQVKGKKIDRRSDIYSLGIILYEMVTGQVPFEGDTPLSIAVKQKSELPRNPRSLNSQIPVELERVILKCLEKEPQKRFQEAEEVCSALTKIQEEMPTLKRYSPKKILGIKSTRMGLRFSRILSIFLIIALLFTAGYFILDQMKKTDAHLTEGVDVSKWKLSVLVLPFQDKDAGKEDENFYINMTDSIISGLQKFKELRVISLFTALNYQDSNKNPLVIAKENDVAHVVWGIMYKEEDGVRLKIELSSTEDGTVLWNFSEKNNRKSFQGLQDSITKELAKALGIQLVDERYDAIATKASQIQIANEYYNSGQIFEFKYYATWDATYFEPSVDNYLKAVEYDPNFALPLWRLGLICEQRFVSENSKQSYNLMRSYFEKAYQIAPELAEANAGLGTLHFHEGDNDSAYQYFKHAYAIDQNNAEINFHIGAFFRSIGLYKKAVKFYDRAFMRNPMHPEYGLWQYVRAECNAYGGKFDEAEAILLEALRVKPDYFLHMNYVKLLLMQKNYDAAEIHISKTAEQFPDRPAVKEYYAWLWAGRGEKNRALELIKDSKNKHNYAITSTYSLLGLKDEAIENIKRGIETGFEEKKMYLYSSLILINNPSYDSLRDDSRFQEIIKEQQERYNEKLSKYGDL